MRRLLTRAVRALMLLLALNLTIPARAGVMTSETSDRSLICAVVDTNILIRAFIKPQGTVGPVLQRLRWADLVVLRGAPHQAVLAERAEVGIRMRGDANHGVHADAASQLQRLEHFARFAADRKRDDAVAVANQAQIAMCRVAGMEIGRGRPGGTERRRELVRDVPRLPHAGA